MDNRQKLEVLNWHAKHSSLNGAEASIMVALTHAADYKTGKVTVSYSELVRDVGFSKVTTAKAITSLVAKKSLAVAEEAKGRSMATYRIRSVDELNGYFVVEARNKDFENWHQTHDEKFGELERQHSSIGEGCPDCTQDKKCEMHTYHLNKLEESTAWREYKLWLIDNPKPKMFVKKIGDKCFSDV